MTQEKATWRNNSINVLAHYSHATGLIAEAEGVPKSEIIERALLAYQIIPAKSNGTRAAGWVHGVKRDASLSIRSGSFERATAIAKAEHVSKGVAVERALLVYIERSLLLDGSVQTPLHVTKALDLIQDVRVYTVCRGYTPRNGGDAWGLMVAYWGPAPYRPRPCFKWRPNQGPIAHREAAQGTAYQCLWCDAYTKTGAEPLIHKAGCPAIEGIWR